MQASGIGRETSAQWGVGEVARAARGAPAAPLGRVAQAPPPGAVATHAERGCAARIGFVARQAELNVAVTGAQRAAGFLDTARTRLGELKAALAASAAGRPLPDGMLDASLARVRAQWHARPAATGGALDASLAFRAAGDAQQRFRLRALDAAALAAGGAETLMFHPAGLGKASASVTFDAATLAGDALADEGAAGEAVFDAARSGDGPAMVGQPTRDALSRRLDRALAPVGIRVACDDVDGLTFTTAESNWPAVRDRMMIQGGGKRFPGGRPSRAQADALPAGIDPASWGVDSAAARHATLREVVRALDTVKRARAEVQHTLDRAKADVDGAVSSGGEVSKVGEAATAIAASFGQDRAFGAFDIFASVASTVKGMSRARVAALLTRA
ncbi:MAG: hypothetical protein V4764_17915 [Burkholderia sp.]